MLPIPDIPATRRLALGSAKLKTLWRLEDVADKLARGMLAFRPTRLIGFEALGLPPGFLTRLRSGEQQIPGWEGTPTPHLATAERDAVLDGCEALWAMRAGRECARFEQAALRQWRLDVLIHLQRNSPPMDWSKPLPGQPPPWRFPTPMETAIKERKCAYRNFVFERGGFGYTRTHIHSGHYRFTDKTLFLLASALGSMRTYTWVCYYICDTRKPSYRYTEYSAARLRGLLDGLHAHYA